MRASLRPSRVKCADFAFFATRDYRAKSVAFKLRHQGEWNTGLRPVRPAGILLAVRAAQFQRSRTPLNETLWTSVFLEHGDPAPI